MSEQYIRLKVEEFAEEMEKTLRLHDEEKGIEGWLTKNVTVRDLIDRVGQELQEIRDAFADCDPIEIVQECVDLANFAMMIRDRTLDMNPWLKKKGGD